MSERIAQLSFTRHLSLHKKPFCKTTEKMKTKSSRKKCVKSRFEIHLTSERKKLINWVCWWDGKLGKFY